MPRGKNPISYTQKGLKIKGAKPPKKARREGGK